MGRGCQPLRATARRRQTLKRKAFEAVVDRPGVLAGDLPMHLRRFLRELEKEGFVECKTIHNEYRWYVADDKVSGTYW